VRVRVVSRRCDIFNLAFHRRTNILRPVGDTSKPEDICLECMAEGASDTAKYRREQYGLYQVPWATPSTTRHIPNDAVGWQGAHSLRYVVCSTFLAIRWSARSPLR